MELQKIIAQANKLVYSSLLSLELDQLKKSKKHGEKPSKEAKEKRKRWADMTGKGSTSAGINSEVPSQVGAENVDLYDDNAFTEFMIPPSETPSQVPAETVCTSKTKYKKAKYSNNGEDKLANVVDKLTTILEKQGEAFINSSVRVYSGNDIFEGLKEMKLEEEDIDDAYLWLLENQDKARAVFGMPLERRLNFLKNMMNA